MKFCKDCKYCSPDISFKSEGSQLRFAKCSHEKAKLMTFGDFEYAVTGVGGAQNCVLMRTPAFNACGVEAAWFEEKPVQPPVTPKPQVHMVDQKNKGSWLRRIIYRVRRWNLE